MSGQSRLFASSRGNNVPAGTLALVRSPLALRCSREQTVLHTLIRQRHLTPSCGGRIPTAERTLDPARMFEESLTTGPELENSVRHFRTSREVRVESAERGIADIASRLDQTVCDTRPKGRKFSRVLSQVLSTDAPHQIPSIFKTPPILPLARRMPVVPRVI